MKNLLTPADEIDSLSNVKCTNGVAAGAGPASTCTKCPIYQRQIETLQLFLAEWCTTLANELSADPTDQQLLFSRSSFAPNGLPTIGSVPCTLSSNNSETNKNEICFLNGSDTGSNSCSPTLMVINSVINSATSTSASIGLNGLSEARQIPGSIPSDVENENNYLVTTTMSDCGDRQIYDQINDANQPAVVGRQNAELNVVSATVSGRPNQQSCGSIFQHHHQPVLAFDGEDRNFVQHPHVQQKQSNNQPPLFLKTEPIPAIAAAIEHGSVGNAGTLVIRQMPQIVQQPSLSNVLIKVQPAPSHFAVNPPHNVLHNNSVIATGNNTRQLPVVVVNDLPDNVGPSKFRVLSAHNFTSNPSFNQASTGMPSSVGLIEVHNSPQLLTSVVSAPAASGSFDGLVLRGLGNDIPVTSRNTSCRPTSTNQLSDLVPLKLNDEKFIIQLPLVPSSMAALSGHINNDSIRNIKFVRYPAIISQGHSNSGTVATTTTVVPFLGTPFSVTPFAAPFTPNIVNSSVASVSCPLQPSLAISGPIFAVAVSSSHVYSTSCQPSNVQVHLHNNYSYATPSCHSSVVVSDPPMTKYNFSMPNGKISIAAASAGISSDGTSTGGSLMATGKSMIGFCGPSSLQHGLSKATTSAIFSSHSQPAVVVTSCDVVMTTAIQSAIVAVPSKSIDTTVSAVSARSYFAANQYQLSQSQHPVNKHPSTAISANLLVNENYGSTLIGLTARSSCPSHDPNHDSGATFGESTPSHVFIDSIDPSMSSTLIIDGASEQSGRLPATSSRSTLNPVSASGVRANVALRKRKSSNRLKGSLSKVANSLVNSRPNQTFANPEVVLSSSSCFSPVSSADVNFDPISDQCLKSANWEGDETRTSATPIGFEFDNHGASNESKMSPSTFATLLTNDPQCTAADAQYEGFFAWKNGGWLCKLCDSTFKKFGKAAKHARSSHLRPNNFSCDKCGKCFDRSSDLKRHVKHAHVRLMLLNYECKICQASFNRKYNLDQHMGTQHPGKVCDCPHCGQKFSWERNLARHINQIHPDKKPVGPQKSPVPPSPAVKEESVGADNITLVDKMSQFSVPLLEAAIASDGNTCFSESAVAPNAMITPNDQSDLDLLDSSSLKTAGASSFPRFPESNSGYNCPAVSNYVTSSRSSCFSQLPQSFLSSDAVICRSTPSSAAQESSTSLNEHGQCRSSSHHINSQSNFDNISESTSLTTSASVSSHEDINNEIGWYLVQPEPGSGPPAPFGNSTPGGVFTSSLSRYQLGAITTSENVANSNCPTEFVQSCNHNPPQQLSPFSAPEPARNSDNKLTSDRLCSRLSYPSGRGAQLLTVVGGTSVANSLGNAPVSGSKIEFEFPNLQGQKLSGNVYCKLGSSSSSNSDCFLSNSANVVTTVEDRTMATVNAVVESAKLRSELNS